MNWKQFEALCVTHLSTTFSLLHPVTFIGLGGANSRKSDIQVISSHGPLFYIEAKMPNSQSGQFVVLSNEDGFYFSQQNSDHNNMYSQKIIDYMNSSGDVFKDPGTKGVDLPLAPSVMADWIKNHYTNKGVEFVISSNDYKNFVIFPVGKLEQYFTISAKYRVKKSGSGSPSRANLNEIKSLLGDPHLKITRINGKYYMKKKGVLDKQQVSGAVYSYQFNKTSTDTLFEIKRLSNTANPNVIFSLELVQSQKPEDLDLFTATLKSITSTASKNSTS